MAHLLLIILEDISFVPELLRVWRDIGIPGATILKGAGGHRTKVLLSRVGLGALDQLFDAREVEGRILMAAIDNDDLLAQAIAEAERIVGGFDRPNSGLLLVLPVSQASGIYKSEPGPAQTVSPPALRPDWNKLRDIPIEHVMDILDLKPIIINRDATLDDVTRAMLRQPQTHVACVIADNDRLVGLISLNVLADDLFFHILPEEFLKEITDLDQVMAFADKTHIRSAGDAMSPPIWVKKEETVKEAFKRMHENQMPGLPVVDDLYHVIGYINLLELLALCIEQKTEADRSEDT